LALGNCELRSDRISTLTKPDMEEEVDEAGAVASVLADGGVDDGLDEALGARAGGVVVAHLKRPFVLIQKEGHAIFLLSHAQLPSSSIRH
jgi:hypothetical protein